MRWWYREGGRSMPPPKAGYWVHFKKYYTCTDPDNNRWRRWLSFNSINHPYVCPTTIPQGDDDGPKTSIRYRIYMASLFGCERVRERERGGSRLSGKKFACAGALFIVLRAGELACEIAYRLSPRGIQSLVLWRDYLIATTRISLIR